jgi:hypothetical protein
MKISLVTTKINDHSTWSRIIGMFDNPIVSKKRKRDDCVHYQQHERDVEPHLKICKLVNTEMVVGNNDELSEWFSRIKTIRVFADKSVLFEGNLKPSYKLYRLLSNDLTVGGSGYIIVRGMFGCGKETWLKNVLLLLDYTVINLNPINGLDPEEIVRILKSYTSIGRQKNGGFSRFKKKEEDKNNKIAIVIHRPEIFFRRLKIQRYNLFVELLQQFNNQVRLIMVFDDSDTAISFSYQKELRPMPKLFKLFTNDQIVTFQSEPEAIKQFCLSCWGKELIDEKLLETKIKYRPETNLRQYMYWARYNVDLISPINHSNYDPPVDQRKDCGSKLWKEYGSVVWAHTLTKTLKYTSKKQTLSDRKNILEGLLMANEIDSYLSATRTSSPEHYTGPLDYCMQYLCVGYPYAKINSEANDNCLNFPKGMITLKKYRARYKSIANKCVQEQLSENQHPSAYCCSNRYKRFITKIVPTIGVEKTHRQIQKLNTKEKKFLYNACN